MHKVLYIGNYNDNTGWGNASKNNILAMNSAGIDVVPRSITYTNTQSPKDEIIKELENKSQLNIDACIQHVLPHLYVYNSNFKNIGYLAVESYDFKDSMWHKHCNIMDEIWVPSNACKESCIRSGVTKPIKIIEHSLDVNKYYNHNSGNQIDELKYTFNFVFIGEFIERKNIEALLRAFHTEFHPSEPVNLYIKTSKKSLQELQDYCDNIKKGLKLRKQYKQEIIVAGFLDFDDYISTLKQCHYFVMPSRGEGFCIPALEAMCVGIPSLYTEGIGMEDFCVGKKIKSNKDRCFGAVSSLDNIYTSNTYWMNIDIEELQKEMRNAFNESQTDKYKQLKKDCIQLSKLFSHENVGQKIKEVLNDS